MSTTHQPDLPALTPPVLKCSPRFAAECDYASGVQSSVLDLREQFKKCPMPGLRFAIALLEAKATELRAQLYGTAFREATKAGIDVTRWLVTGYAKKDQAWEFTFDDAAKFDAELDKSP